MERHSDDGWISCDELSRASEDIGEKCTVEEVDEATPEADDGRVDRSVRLATRSRSVLLNRSEFGWEVRRDENVEEIMKR